MAKTNAPLMSFSAHGAIAKTVTFRKSNGQNIVSGFSKPNDYKKTLPSASQLEQRALYQNAVLAWNSLSQGEKDVYNSNAKKYQLTGFNLYLKENLGAIPSTLLNDLLYYFKLDDLVGNTLDSTGFSYGEVTGCTRGVTGKVDKCFSFASTSDYISVPNNPLVVSPKMSFSFWVKLNSISTILSFFSTRTNSNFFGFIILLNTPSTFVIDFNGDGFMYRWYPNYILPLNEFVHIVITKNNITGLRELYANGSRVNYITTTTSSDDTGEPLLIGKDNLGPTYHIDGLLDEIGIWKRVLTSDEVLDLYNSGNGKTYPFLS